MITVFSGILSLAFTDAGTGNPRFRGVRTAWMGTHSRRRPISRSRHEIDQTKNRVPNDAAPGHPIQSVQTRVIKILVTPKREAQILGAVADGVWRRNRSGRQTRRNAARRSGSAPLQPQVHQTVGYKRERHPVLWSLTMPSRSFAGRNPRGRADGGAAAFHPISARRTDADMGGNDKLSLAGMDEMTRKYWRR